MDRGQRVVLHLTFAFLATVALPALVPAQNYQQDFSATFPPIVEPQALVTVVLENEDGDVITPYVDFPVNGLSAYPGRPQFAGRTGGATVDSEVGPIQATYTSGGADTNVLYGVDPLPAVGGNGVYIPDRVLDDAFITMTEDGLGNIQSAAAWDVVYSDSYDQVTFTFPFRIWGAANPANDYADGLGFSYLATEFHGETGIVGPGVSEEPTYYGSFGVGLDIWDSGWEGGNSVSLHFNEAVVASRSIDEGTTDPNTGLDWAFNTLELGDVITATISITPGAKELTQLELLGGSPYSTWRRGQLPPALVPVGGEGSTEGYLRITEEVEGASNVVAFDYDGGEASTEMYAALQFSWTQ